MDVVCKNGRHFYNLEAARACTKVHDGGCSQCEETPWLPVKGNYSTNQPIYEPNKQVNDIQLPIEKYDNQCPSQLHRTRMFPCPRCCYSESISETGYFFKTTTFWLCKYPNVVNWNMLQPEDILLEEAQLSPQIIAEKPIETSVKQEVESSKQSPIEESKPDVSENENGAGYNCGICGKWFGSDKEAWSHVYANHQAEIRLQHIESLVKESSPTSRSVTGSEWSKSDARQRWEQWKREPSERKDRTMFELLLQLISRWWKRKRG